jgi:hypothetical protein
LTRQSSSLLVRGGYEQEGRRRWWRWKRGGARLSRRGEWEREREGGKGLSKLGLEEVLELLSVGGELDNALVELGEGHTVLEEGPAERGLVVDERDLLGGGAKVVDGEALLYPTARKGVRKLVPYLMVQKKARRTGCHL